MMLQAARLIATLGTARVQRIGSYARSHGIALAVLGLFFLVTAFFILATVTAALAREMGVVNAFMVMSIASLAGCVATSLVVRAQQRRRARQKALEAMQDRQIAQTAFLALIPRFRGKTLLTMGAVGIGALLLSRRAGRGDD